MTHSTFTGSSDECCDRRYYEDLVYNFGGCVCARIPLTFFIILYRNRQHLNNDTSLKYNSESSQTDPLVTKSHGDLRSDFFQQMTKEAKDTLRTNHLLARQLQRRLKQVKSSGEMPNLKYLQNKMGAHLNSDGRLHIPKPTDRTNVPPDGDHETDVIQEQRTQKSLSPKPSNTNRQSSRTGKGRVGTKPPQQSALRRKNVRNKLSLTIDVPGGGVVAGSRGDIELEQGIAELEKELEADQNEARGRDPAQRATEHKTDDLESLMDEIVSNDASTHEVRPTEPATLGLSNRVKGGNKKQNKISGLGDAVLTAKPIAAAKKKKKSLAQIQNDVTKMSKKLGDLKKGMKESEESTTVADVCYYCKQPGHWKIHCPELAKYKDAADAEKRENLQGTIVAATSQKNLETELAAGMIEGYPNTSWGRGMAMKEKTVVTVTERLPGVPHHTDKCYYCEQTGHWKGNDQPLVACIYASAHPDAIVLTCSIDACSYQRRRNLSKMAG